MLKTLSWKIAQMCHNSIKKNELKMYIGVPIEAIAYDIENTDARLYVSSAPTKKLQGSSAGRAHLLWVRTLVRSQSLENIYVALLTKVGKATFFCSILFLAQTEHRYLHSQILSDAKRDSSSVKYPGRKAEFVLRTKWSLTYTCKEHYDVRESRQLVYRQTQF